MVAAPTLQSKGNLTNDFVADDSRPAWHRGDQAKGGDAVAQRQCSFSNGCDAADFEPNGD
jgi:hypothetical protein